MQTVYVDLYFLINFSMDFLCLYLTAKLLSERLAPIRGILAAAIGGIYANLALLLGLSGFTAILSDLAVCALICLAAFFGRGRIKRAPVYILVYVAVSAALGGIMTALFYLFNRTGIFDFIKNTDGDGISVWLFAFLAAISAVITLIGGRGATKKMSAREVELEVTFFGRTVTLRGMSDSGNLLREPLSGKPCIVVDRKGLGGLLSKRLSEILSKGNASGLEGLTDDEKRRIVLIPARTATGADMLVGIRVERVLVRCGGKEREADAVLALSELEVGALVPSCLLI